MTERPALVTLAARPDLLEGVLALSAEWPSFMLHDPVAREHQGRLLELAEFQLALLDDAGDVVARGLSVPFGWDGLDASLPDRGWDAVLEHAADDLDHGREGTAVAGLEITIAVSHQGRGLTEVMIRGLRGNAARLGFPDVVIPVRPTGKAAEPFTPMGDYAARTRRGDGAPADSWLRAHWRAGGRTVGVCERSMTIPGSIAQWQAWTGMRFTASGLQVVPGGLAPVAVDLERDEAVYVEPNVWVHHRAGGQR